MENFLDRIKRRLHRETVLQENRQRVNKLSASVIDKVDEKKHAPVVIFNASTRLSGISQNAGFSLITSLALRSAGIPVIQFVCNRALTPCVLGTDRDHPMASPPCNECVRTSRYLFKGCDVHWLTQQSNTDLDAVLRSKSLANLLTFEKNNIPVGKLILPSLRWILRKHHLEDDAATRSLARSYIQSAWHVYSAFNLLLESRRIHAVVVFNGMFYPEAMARFAARKKGIPVYSHEVGMLPFSAFFTDKEAPAYPVAIDSDFALDDQQNKRLDAYLANRFRGNFQTAGVAFWPEMKNLDEAVSEKIAAHNALVPVFTNVIFDTSQAHANTLFAHMFDWLDLVVEKIKEHPETLFIIRAHPDEVRPGKESRESVSDWFTQHHLSQIPNLLFIAPDEFVSSYDLIKRAKFVMVYNSTVGLEASIMGKPVLCAGKARYTQVPTVFFPDTKVEYTDRLDLFLRNQPISQPALFVENARKVLYSQLFRASLPFDEYLEDDGVWKGYVRLKDIDPHRLMPSQYDVLRVVTDGILQGKPFIRNI